MTLLISHIFMSPRLIANLFTQNVQTKITQKSCGAVFKQRRSGSEPSDILRVPEAAFFVDEEVHSLVDVFDGRRVTKGAQAVVSKVKNSTQT